MPRPRPSIPVSPADNPNRLLAALPDEDYARIRESLEMFSAAVKKILHKPGETIHYLYFPGNGFCSVLAVLEDGRMIEVATVGREGVVGSAAVLDSTPPTHVTMVQADIDPCFRMSVDAYRAEVNRREAFYELMTRFTQALVGGVMQSAACNAVHTVEQRLARWLLMAHDRVEKESFELTQEFAAMMLGVTRPTVSVVAATLQKAGLITYQRGRLTVVDRAGLEDASCECYRTVTALVNNVSSKASGLTRRP
jgi:CRP-like cAMP-binding protein